MAKRQAIRRRLGPKAPAGLRVLERVLVAEFGRAHVVACYPHDLDRFIGPDTRAVAVSTHNPLDTTFAAGVYTSIFGSSREPINAHYAALLFDTLQRNPYRPAFKVIVGGSGGWKITRTGTAAKYGVDCIVDGRSEARETIDLFHNTIGGAELPAQAVVHHPGDSAGILAPELPTTLASSR